MYRYDLAGKLINSYVYDSDTMRNLSGTMLQYDKESRLSGVDYCYDYTYSGGIAEVKDSYSYIYDETTGNISRVNIHGAGARGTLSYNFDKFYRAQSKTVSLLVGNTDVFYNHITYDYVNSLDTSGDVHLNESGLVSQYKSTVKQSENGDEISSATYNYSYDDLGNITGIRNGSNEIQNKYYYDDLGQLIREDNLAKNATYVYTYDNAGNITSKKTYAFTTGTLGTATSTVNYTYGNSWGDLLTSYNGAPITYDAIGNPTAIDLDTLTWQGRELQTYTNEYYEISYTYNADGIRTRKDLYEPRVGYTTRYEYTLSGTQIISETVYLNMSYPENYIEQYRMIYLYDENGAPIGIKYRTPSYAAEEFDYYFFEKNLQGDIVAIYNESGVKVGTYTYDAWGNHTATATSRRRLRDCFVVDFCFYNPSVSLTRATSLYTREAHYHPTVHLKGVTR